MPISSGLFSIFITAVVSIVMGLVIKQFRPPKATTQETYGSAHFANPDEINAMNLINVNDDVSVYVGAWQHPKTQVLHYLRFNGPEHVFAYAPSRSGKGVGLVIPTLLSFSGSMIVSDIKGENWQITAGYRKAMGQHVIKFDPTNSDGSSASFNPLLEIRKGLNEIRDIQNLVDVIADPYGEGKHDHWSNSANDLLVSLILHVLYAEKDKSLTGVRNFLSNPSRSDEETFQIMLTTEHDVNNRYDWRDPMSGEPTRIHPIIASGAKDMLSKSDSERSGIISTLKTLLKLYRDPIIAANTRTCDFTIHDIVSEEIPMTLYLVIPPGDLNRTMPLMRLVLNQILNRLTESLEVSQEKNNPEESEKPKRHKLNLLLDEFPQFGRLEFLEKSLAYLSGYGISAYLIAQDLAQVYKAFGHYQAIISNCHIRIAYAPNTYETAKHLSELIGSTTLIKTHKHYSGSRWSAYLKHINISEQETRRELLTPDELMRLPEDVAIIFKTGHAPIYGKKIKYYLDPVFSQRAKLSTPVTDKLSYETVWTDVATVETTLNTSEFSVAKDGEDISDELSFDILPNELVNLDEDLT